MTSAIVAPEIRAALVTGGAGFIGSHLVDALLERSVRVRVIDNLSTGKREPVAAAAEFVEADIRNPDSFRDTFESIVSFTSPHSRAFRCRLKNRSKRIR